MRCLSEDVMVTEAPASDYGPPEEEDGLVQTGQLVSSDKAMVCPKQHAKPCADCPWLRSSLAGWTGATSVEDWVKTAHSDARVDCHTLRRPGKEEHWQCVGIATYRANVGKAPRDGRVLRAKKDKDKVFAGPGEFGDHHKKGLDG
jgi:hypothetical protein